MGASRYINPLTLTHIRRRTLALTGSGMACSVQERLNQIQKQLARASISNHSAKLITLSPILEIPTELMRGGGRKARTAASKKRTPLSLSLSLSPSFLIRCRHICRAMTNSRALPALAMRAAHNNCSAQQKAEIPIQSLELILRTARRKLGSVDVGCNGDRRSSDRHRIWQRVKGRKCKIW